NRELSGASGRRNDPREGASDMKKSQSESDRSKPAGSSSDWRGELLSRLRALIMEADPGMTEERKWIKPSNPAGVPTFSHNGLVCTGETYKSTVKLTFARGASLPDPSGLFNSSLEGNTRRAIDFREGDKVDEEVFRLPFEMVERIVVVGSSQE